MKNLKKKNCLLHLKKEKSVSASLLFLLFIGCEDTRVGHEHDIANVTVVMPLIERIELNDNTWQTLVTMYGTLDHTKNHQRKFYNLI